MCKPAPYFAKVKKLYQDAQLPTYESEYAAGADLYAYMQRGFVRLRPHESAMIGTGVAITPPVGYFGAIYARSGLAAKRGLRPANCVGVADGDYTGEYKVCLYNDSDKIQTVYHGDRIAQLVIQPYIHVNFREVDELDKTERGDGGFGSTGV